MRVLWVSTSPMGPASRILEIQQTGSSGGWIQSEYEALMREDHSEVEMFFLCGSRSVAEGTVLRKQTEEGIAFCVNLPKISFGKELPAAVYKNVKDVIDEVKPDVIHIWGTESCISHGAAKAGEGIRKVVFLQGIIGIHQRYKGGYLANTEDNLPYISPDPLKTRIVTRMKRSYFKKQIAYEQYTLRNSRGVIIDNEFSEAYCKTVSPELTCYYRFLHPNTLFTEADWSYDACQKNTIFTVFGKSTEKGMHQLLKAVAIVKETVPDVKLIIPGPFSCEGGRLKDKRRLVGFERWMANFIEANGLTDNVIFPGKLSPAQMVEQLQNCHMFVNPSCMECHALSLREAMTVGTPSVTSLCGSVIEYVTHNENGLIYRYEEHEMLSYLIKKVLGDRAFAEHLSRGAKASMAERRARSNCGIMDIYRDLMSQ